MSKKTIRIGLVGFGTVGTGVWNILEQHAELLSQRTQNQFDLSVTKIAVRDLSKKRSANVSESILTTDWNEVVNSPEVDLVIELIGGTGIAYDVVAAALKAGKPVISGNKALLAERGAEVFALSKKHQTPVFFEASIAGGIPIVKAVQESFVGNKVNSLVGIINGTCNYILERMTDAGLSYKEALKEAMELGYAEADPTLDINGWDAGHKAMLLASLSYGVLLQPEQTYVTGIETVSLEDIQIADKLGYAVKLLSVVRQNEQGQIEVRTQPSLISQKHLLSHVNGVFNAVSLKVDQAGDAFLYGRGAGQEPTASSVLSDVIDACHFLKNPKGWRTFLPYNTEAEVLDIQDTETAYFIRIELKDEPGVMAKVTSMFTENGISFSGTYSNMNPEDPDAEMNHVAFVTHKASFRTLNNALEEVKALSCVTKSPSVYRIEKLS